MNTTPRKFYDTGCINHGGFRYFRDEDSTTRCSGCNEIISTPDLPSSGQPAKKLTPMGELYDKFNGSNTVSELFEWVYDNKERLIEAEREMVESGVVYGNSRAAIEDKQTLASNYFTQNYQQ